MLHAACRACTSHTLLRNFTKTIRTKPGRLHGRVAGPGHTDSFPGIVGHRHNTSYYMQPTAMSVLRAVTPSGQGGTYSLRHGSQRHLLSPSSKFFSLVVCTHCSAHASPRPTSVPAHTIRRARRSSKSNAFCHLAFARSTSPGEASPEEMVNSSVCALKLTLVAHFQFHVHSKVLSRRSRGWRWGRTRLSLLGDNSEWSICIVTEMEVVARFATPLHLSSCN